MGRQTIEKTIRQQFPADASEEIRSMLERYDAKRSPAGRDADFLTMLTVSQGDTATLKQIIEQANRDAETLPLYRRWLDIEKQYNGEPACLQYFAEWVLPIALEAVPHQLSGTTSHMSLVLHPLGDHTSARLVVIPLLDGSVFATTNEACLMEGKKIESLAHHEGRHVQCEQLRDTVREMLDGRSAA